MNTGLLSTVLPTLLRELVHGSPDPRARTYMLNRGDAGLLTSLQQLSADAASARSGGAPSIAAHVDHLRFGLSLLNAWAMGTPTPWGEADWTASWQKSVVTEVEWGALLDALRGEAVAWEEALRAPREVSDLEAGWMAGSVAHLAYHFGSIRQLDRATRGPTAEDEAEAEAAGFSSARDHLGGQE